MLAAAGCIASSVLTWLSLPDGAGGTTLVSGWGAISGGSQIAGENINDAMNGNAGDYAGASLTLARHGGPAAEDNFGFDG